MGLFALGFIEHYSDWGNLFHAISAALNWQAIGVNFFLSLYYLLRNFFYPISLYQTLLQA